MSKVMEFEYMLQPPKKYTFEQPQLKKFVEKYCRGKVLNLFSGKVKLNVDEYRVDLSPDFQPHFVGDAYVFITTTQLLFDTVILDPPYSVRKSREKYEGRTIGSFTKIKDNITRILNDEGRVITLGYSSVGMSRRRGFEKIALGVVCHNGDHDDTLCLVESKLQANAEKDLLILVEERRLANVPRRLEEYL